MSTPPPDHADVIRNALRLAADNAYPDDLARPYQEALRALTEGEITVTVTPPPFGETGPTKPCGCGPDEPCRKHAEYVTARSGQPVTDEAAEALRGAGFVIVSRDDLKAILEGKASPDQWMQLAAVIGVSR